ncbi:MAG TPA: undecaprenyl-diphosphate phosphatase [Bacteroidales bacterium]|nr:undecaprenyl-diphosphate phosphatase [Bacteroidales bacterium]
MKILHALILSLIEGLTEFLPVSSTGHMILASALMKIDENEFVKTFEIAIQSGAIIAIAFIYFKRFLHGLEIYFKLAAAFIPTALVGFLAYDYVKKLLFNPIIVAISLIIGGIILILVDRKVTGKKSIVSSLEQISYKNAFFIGLIQCFSIIPGTSRAAATIVGGLFNGLDKKQATEFSFLLAIPVMFSATGYDLYKTTAHFSWNEYMLLFIGITGAFISALFAVKIFLRIVENYGFIHFGVYRIILGVVFLIWII